MNTKTFGFDEQRLAKRSELLARSVNPYPYTFNGSTKVAVVISEAERREASGEELSFTETLAGRIWARRDMGKTSFLDLRDDSGKIQLYLSHKRKRPPEPFGDWG